MESAKKNFEGKVHDWLKKDWIYFLHFNRMAARNLPTQWRILLILFKQHPVNFVQTTSGQCYRHMLVVVLFVYLFIHFAGEWV